MIIGKGQLAQVFMPYDIDNSLIFASGVANSNSINSDDFNREVTLLEKVISENENRVLVYFSSCALSASGYKKNAYYEHKSNMEDLIKEKCSHYLIIRLPQVFGTIKPHNTLINYFYYQIINQVEFAVYSDAYRYLIDLEDIPEFVLSLLNKEIVNQTIDFSNPYRYKITEILDIMQNELKIEAKYKIIKKTDQYILNLEKMHSLCNNFDTDFDFGPDYFKNKFYKYVQIL